MKHLFIINPAAGSRNRTKEFSEKIEAAFAGTDLSYRIEISSAPGECARIAREAAQTGEEYRIYSCGGDGTMNEIINGYLTARQEYKAALNHAKEEAFLAENAKNEGVQTTESGLQYKLVSAGADYKVQPQDTVWVSYKGTLLDGTVFDQNDSTRFIANRVIKGWTEGLGLLGEGGEATLYIPAELAYGQRGNRGIAPNSTLIFDVKVHKVGKFVEESK